MKTQSNRYRCKGEGEKLENAKRKALFVTLQFTMSLAINLVGFAILKENYISTEVWIQLLQVFLLAFISVFTSNFLALGIVVAMYKIDNVRSFLTRDGSYVKFFAVSLLYSFFTAVAFTYGIFWLIYYALGDSTFISLILIYAVGYLIMHFASYGLVTWAYQLTKTARE